jgi:hypothetical protein
MNEDDLDFENRQLCPDDLCTGVLGSDGRCKECGRSADGAAPAGAPTARVAAGESGPAIEESFDDDDRQLCPDGSCTGLLGADGKCKECGTMASASVST